MRKTIGALLACATLAGCTLHANLSATGAVPASTTHLAVTLQGVWFATAADTAPEAASGWVKRTLATPVGLDLAALTPGTLVALASQLSVPSGSYHQVHLVLADSADSLTSAAQSLGLYYNSQISLTDSNGNLVNAALEALVPQQGLTIATSLTLNGSISFGSSSTSSTTSSGAASGTTTSSTSSTGSVKTLVLAVDGARDVLRYTYGSTTGYLLSPVTSVVDESLASGITGSVDASALAAGYPPVFVSAQTISADATHHVVVARRPVASDGTFSLYPLPAPKSGKTYYDVVISGAGAGTVIVRSVPVSAAAVGSATRLQSAAIPLSAASTVYADLSPQSPLLPGGTRVDFYQTVNAAAELPYVIDSTAVDPLSRRLPGGAFALGAGPLSVGSYAGGGAVGFTTAAPAEGNAGYLLGTEGLYRADALASAPTRVSGNAAAPTLALAPAPVLAAGAIAGRLSVTLSSGAGRYDSGFLVVSSGNRLVETAAVGNVLAAGGGNVAITVPGGSALAATGGVPYQVALRAWNSADPQSTFVRVAAPVSASMGDSGAASVSITAP